MKVLFAYDGFPHSRHALKEVAELAPNGDAEVTILSVVPEAEARGSKAGRRRWLLPHAHSYLHEQAAKPRRRSPTEILQTRSARRPPGAATASSCSARGGMTASGVCSWAA
jgi:nucleotide-binding universal stress UspA family protein